MSTTPFKKVHERFMAESLRLAQKGRGYVSPNPMVGAVLVRNGHIISRGYHRKFGGPHAEVVCISSAPANLKSATLYVNFEPCSHYGKTPPCADLIIQSGIRKVVVGMQDPNPLVSGNGIKRLRDAGIKVITGVLRPEAMSLNRVFSRHIVRRMPYVHVKVAQTIDGRIGRYNHRSKLTSRASMKLVHRWRADHDAILIGAGTLKVDDPLLTVRMVRGRNPDVVILDGRFTVQQQARVFDTAQDRRVFLLTTRKSAARQKVKARKLSSRGVHIVEFVQRTSVLPLDMVLATLYGHHIGSILVEGGSEVFTQFLERPLIDELSLFVVPAVWGSGIPAFMQKQYKNINARKATKFTAETIGTDMLLKAYF